ncbi:MAG: redoxin domain-containing protein [Bacteroidales bacterium]|nr:redoxin domain-containing protein [Bacteroidales bacterium]
MKISLAGVTDVFLSDNVYTINSKNGSFAADVPLNSGNIYQLDAFFEKNNSMHVFFFADQDTVCVLMDGGKCPNPTRVLSAGGSNQEYQLYLDELRARFSQEDQAISKERLSSDVYFTDEYKELEHRIKDNSLDSLDRNTIRLTLRQMLVDSTAYTPKAFVYLSRRDRLRKEKLDFTKTYLKARQPSLALFAVLYESLRTASMLDYDYADWAHFYANTYAHKFQECNLHQAVDYILSAQLVREGFPFIDFTLPDQNGVPQTLSDLIKGKYALVQFWATWCASCVSKRHTIHLIYDQYKDKGFTVIEVAREFKNDAKWRSIIRRDGADWTDLLAMEENHSIGAEYGLSQKAGALFLIDPNGTVLSIDPTREEIEAMLEGLFQD